MTKTSLKTAKIMRTLVIIAIVAMSVNVSVTAFLAAVYGGAYAVGSCVAAVIALGLNLYSLFALNRTIENHGAEHG